MWHTITYGDSLSTLAAKFLGSMMLYMDIYEANKDVLTDPNVVRQGQTIWIPKDGKPNPKFVTGDPFVGPLPQDQIVDVTPKSSSNTAIQNKTGIMSIFKDPNKLMMFGGIGLGVVALLIYIRNRK